MSTSSQTQHLKECQSFSCCSIRIPVQHDCCETFFWRIILNYPNNYRQRCQHCCVPLEIGWKVSLHGSRWDLAAAVCSDREQFDIFLVSDFLVNATLRCHVSLDVVQTSKRNKVHCAHSASYVMLTDCRLHDALVGIRVISPELLGRSVLFFLWFCLRFVFSLSLSTPCCSVSVVMNIWAN